MNGARSQKSEPSPEKIYGPKGYVPAERFMRGLRKTDSRNDKYGEIKRKRDLGSFPCTPGQYFMTMSKSRIDVLANKLSGPQGDAEVSAEDVKEFQKFVDGGRGCKLESIGRFVE